MERHDLEDIGVDARIILKCIFKAWTGMMWFKIWTDGGFLCMYEGWNFNSGYYLFTTDTK